VYIIVNADIGLQRLLVNTDEVEGEREGEGGGRELNKFFQRILFTNAND